MIVKLVYELFFFYSEFQPPRQTTSGSGSVPQYAATKTILGLRSWLCSYKTSGSVAWQAKFRAKNQDFTRALVLEKHAEWPKLNHNTFLLKSIGLFSSQELSFAAPRVLPFSLHRCGFIVSLLCCLCGLGAPANLKHLRVLRVLCGHNFFCKASNILSSDVRDRLVIFLQNFHQVIPTQVRVEQTHTVGRHERGTAP